MINLKLLFTASIGTMFTSFALSQTPPIKALPLPPADEYNSAFGGVSEISNLIIMSEISTVGPQRARLGLHKSDDAGGGNIGSVNLNGVQLAHRASLVDGIYLGAKSVEIWTIKILSDGRFMLSLSAAPNYCVAIDPSETAVLMYCNKADPTQQLFLQKSSNPVYFQPRKSGPALTTKYTTTMVLENGPFESYYIRSAHSKKFCLNIWSSDPNSSLVNFEPCEAGNTRKKFIFDFVKQQNSTSPAGLPSTLLAMASVFHLMDYEKDSTDKLYSSAITATPITDFVVERKRFVPLLFTSPITGGTVSSLVANSPMTLAVSAQNINQTTLTSKITSQFKYSFEESAALKLFMNPAAPVGGFGFNLDIGFKATQEWLNSIEVTSATQKSTQLTSGLAIPMVANEEAWFTSKQSTMLGRSKVTIETNLGDRWSYNGVNHSFSGFSSSASLIHCSSTMQPSAAYYAQCAVEKMMLNAGIASSDAVEGKTWREGEQMKVGVFMENNRCLTNFTSGNSSGLAQSTNCVPSPWSGSYWYLEAVSVQNGLKFRLHPGSNTNKCLQAPWNRLTSPNFYLETCANNPQQYFTFDNNVRGLHTLAFEDAASFSASRPIETRSYFPKNNRASDSEESNESVILRAVGVEQSGWVSFIALP